MYLLRSIELTFGDHAFMVYFREESVFMAVTVGL